MQGGFSVQLGTRNPFGRIPVDQTTEETVNKVTQTSSGTKGFSLKPGAVSRYYLMSEYRSTYIRIKKDETDDKAFVEWMEKSWVNPLSLCKAELGILSTGVVVTPDVASDLVKAQDKGGEA